MLKRQLGIVYLLMKKQTVTAAELAERYEVSVRTIYRDVETLSMAGIPIYARKGKNGGISLTEQFVLNKLLVTEEEQQQILAALESLSEVGAQTEQDTLRKLGDFFKMEPQNWVAIDFSDWSGRRQKLFEDIKQAILHHQVMKFDYYGQYGEMSNRTVEPIRLLFKEYTWYLRAFCRSRQAMRTFKVFRMKRVTVMSETFEGRRNEQENVLCSESSMQEEGAKNTAKKGSIVVDIPVTYDISKNDNCVTANIETVIFRVAKSEAYRVYDRFEEDEITQEPAGSFLIKVTYALDDWVYGMILSYAPTTEVLAPAYVREEVIHRLEKMMEIYRK